MTMTLAPNELNNSSNPESTPEEITQIFMECKSSGRIRDRVQSIFEFLGELLLCLSDSVRCSIQKNMSCFAIGGNTFHNTALRHGVAVASQVDILGILRIVGTLLFLRCCGSQPFSVWTEKTVVISARGIWYTR